MAWHPKKTGHDFSSHHRRCLPIPSPSRPLTAHSPVHATCVPLTHQLPLLTLACSTCPVQWPFLLLLQANSIISILLITSRLFCPPVPPACSTLNLPISVNVELYTQLLSLEPQESSLISPFPSCSVQVPCWAILVTSRVPPQSAHFSALILCLEHHSGIQTGPWLPLLPHDLQSSPSPQGV